LVKDIQTPFLQIRYASTVRGSSSAYSGGEPFFYTNSEWQAHYIKSEILC